jgi:transcriptional regulator with XRE-family HTH domain
MFESKLTQYVRAIRQKNNVSDIKAADRCGLTLSEYILLEKNVETLALTHLKTVFQAIEMTQDEFFDLQELMTKVELTQIKDLKTKINMNIS